MAQVRLRGPWGRFCLPHSIPPTKSQQKRSPGSHPTSAPASGPRFT